MIDTHTHLDHLENADDAVVAARAAGVHGMISIGCGAESINATLDIARRHENCVRVAVGVHPLGAAEFDLKLFDQIAELASDPLVVAIGETGFDQFHKKAGTLDQQQPAFALQAELARTLNLPLIIHTRDAERYTIDQLTELCEGLTVVLHCFSLPDYLPEVIANDWYCSFAGNITYDSADALRKAISKINDERVLVETDAPYLTPVPHRGEKNEPALVPHTLAVVASELGWSVEVADLILTRNSVSAFGLPAEWNR
ncbi:MAG: TatD family hydrolase [Thermoleophilia bacterium]|nr:TatD family hydrolase [Thermoleophilia bacterium]